MVNRMKEYEGNDRQEASTNQRQQIQVLLERIAQVGDELFGLMAPGLSVVVDLPKKNKIISLKEAPGLRRLIITRPSISVQYEVPKGEL